jgi:hypothetical protein
VVVDTAALAEIEFFRSAVDKGLFVFAASALVLGDIELSILANGKVSLEFELVLFVRPQEEVELE